MDRYTLFGIAYILTLVACTARAQPYTVVDAFPELELSWPVEIKQAPHDPTQVYVVEWTGRIRNFENSPTASVAPVFLDLTDRAVDAGAEAGLLGLAFHPNFQENGRFFVSYVGKGEDPLQLFVSRFHLDAEDPSRGDPGSERILLTVEQSNKAHNGGQLHFGPDGYLYIGLGDGGAGDSTARANAQDLTTLQGSILRLDVDAPGSDRPYGIPIDNPFADSTDGVREEIFAYGLRNPWRFSFDRLTGEVWAGDVGEAHWEEINRIEAGANYGWSRMEGTSCYPSSSSCDGTGIAAPIWQYGRDIEDADPNAGVAVIGGFVYRGSRHPELTGQYVFADYDAARLSRSESDEYRQKIWALEHVGSDSVTVRLIARPPLHRVLTFGELNDGELLIGALSIDEEGSLGGRLYRLESAVPEATGELPSASLGITSTYPNPFRQATTISYTLDAPGDVEMAAYDMVGRRVATLVSGFRGRGEHRTIWAGPSTSGSLPASGTYVVRLTADRRILDTVSVTHVR